MHTNESLEDVDDTPIGLTMYNGFVSAEEGKALLKHIAEGEWVMEISRRTQHYGKRYRYADRALVPAPPVPEWLLRLAQKVGEVGGFPKTPDQVIVNHYKPGQGIAPHVDHVKHFGPVVATLSLGRRVDICFAHKIEERHVNVAAEVGSLLVMEGDARYKWTHSLHVPRDGGSDERVSITFRTLRET